MVIDPGLEAVTAEIYRRDPQGQRIAAVIRRTLDQLYDGQNTGRYSWSQLMKTERTHCGTLVEINLQREFRFADGTRMDFSIAGHDVDCKYSQKLGGWMIPTEAIGELCLVLNADDVASRWSCGLARALPEYLTSGTNRDSKRTFTAEARDHYISWLFHEAPLPENTLLHLSDPDREAIFGADSGQARLDELFRRAQGRPIGRGVIATVAQQADYMKRIRGNGGSRSRLRPEGLILLGDSRQHQSWAREIGLPVPLKGETISARVVPAETHWAGPRLEHAGIAYRLAVQEDPVVPAPDLPNPRAAVSGDA